MKVWRFQTGERSRYLRVSRILRESSKLPPWETIVEAADTYLLYCDCQPLPLFRRHGFIQSLSTRDTEVLFAMLALTLRFSENASFLDDRHELARDYMETSRKTIMKKVTDGMVELSTIQSLCLISLVDFTSEYSQLC